MISRGSSVPGKTGEGNERPAEHSAGRSRRKYEKERSTLDRAGGDALDDELAQSHIHDHDRQDGQKAMESTRKYLLGEYGVELLHPCYTEYHLELGEISSYPPGFKENGSVFCHNNPWIVCAEAELGRGNEAFDIYRLRCLL